jgi:translation initiation factor 2 subunit 3
MDLETQPILNIGMLGSVSDGKSTTVFRLTGLKTQKHSSELKRNITIKPGYANMKIYENNNLDTKYLDTKYSENSTLVHHLSFIDCPGHYELILTMLSNIDLMNGAIVIVSASEPIEKKPQLIHHLMAIKIAKIDNFIICLNKLDLIKKDEAIKRKQELDNLLEKMELKPKNIIPVCMSKGLGIEYLLDNIMKYFPPIIKNNNDYPIFKVSRTFDINKNDIDYKDISGGVLGGSLSCGKLTVGDIIEISPGIVNKNQNGDIIYKPLSSVITSLKTETNELTEARVGGLIGIGTNIDPYYCKNDNLIGNVIGLKGHMPPVYTELKIKFISCNFEDTEWKPEINRKINIMVSTFNTSGTIINIDEYLTIKLDNPVCLFNGLIILIENNTTKQKNIVGYGYINIYKN